MYTIHLTTTKKKTIQRHMCVYWIHGERYYLPGVSDSSRIPNESGTTSSEAPESTSRMVDGLSTRKQKQCLQQRFIIHYKAETICLKMHYARELILFSLCVSIQIVQTWLKYLLFKPITTVYTKSSVYLSVVIKK